MQRCIQLALKAKGYTYPNPMVGCLIVHNNKIISEGWHKKYGQNHAEIEAINKVKDLSILSKSTLYITLEPCVHYGKTNPCVDRIILEKIPRIVIGSKDISKKINGKGIKKLLESGLNVRFGVLENECNDLNKRFFKYHIQKKPYIILKWAESKDGFIAPKKEFRKNKMPYWLSTELSRQVVHKWRAQEQSVLVGVQTVIDDDPMLNVRDYKGKSPLRIVIDPNNRIPANSKLLNDSRETLIISNSKNMTIRNKKWEKINFDSFFENFFKILFEKKIQSILVEGGYKTLKYFIDENYYDEIKIIKTQSTLKKGLRSPKFKGKMVSKEYLDGDLINTFK